MKKTLFVLLGFVLLFSLLLGACGKTTPATTTAAATTTAPAATTKAPSATTTAPAATTTAPTGDQYGGTWREALTVGPARPIGYPSEAGNDSFTDSSPSNETLLGVKLDSSVYAVLATSWKIADDGTSITLGLRKGVKFHDGSDFNADVCKWNLDLQIAAKTAGAASWKSIDKIDDYTIRINLNSYQNTALTNLSAGVTQQVSKAYVDKNGIEAARWNPVGTGPFIFVSFERDAKITYKRNPNYWDPGKPYVDGVTMTVVADATVRKLAFQKGDFDRLAVAGGLDAQELQKAGYDMKTQAGGTFLLIPDSANAKSPWSNINVRLAASYALDRDALANGLGLGFLRPAYQLYPGYPDTNIPNLVFTKYNTAKAKELLTQAGYPNGFKTVIHNFNRVVPQDYATAVAAQLRAVGIDVTTDFPTSGKYDDLRYKGWNDGPLNHGLITMSNKNSTLTTYFSGTGFVSLKMPAGFYEGVDATLSSKDYNPKLMQAVLQLMYDDMTVIPYTEQIQISFFRKGVHDPSTDEIGIAWPRFKDVWIEKSARK
jgi:peptide/nickel transport system substrate-binding protein